MRAAYICGPRVWTLDNFKAVFRGQKYLNSFAVTIAKCAVGNRDKRALYVPGILRSVQAEPEIQKV